MLATVTANGAALFADGAIQSALLDDASGDATPALRGELNLATGRFTAEARRWQVVLADVLTFTADGVHLILDPSAPGTSICSGSTMSSVTSMPSPTLG